MKRGKALQAIARDAIACIERHEEFLQRECASLEKVERVLLVVIGAAVALTLITR